MGRPSKYQDSFPDFLVDQMSIGLSFEACCGSMGINKDTGYEWIKRYPEFAEAKLRGEALGQLFWEQKAIDNLELDAESKFNSTVWIFTMKNRFGWRDRRELSGSVGVGGLERMFGDMTNDQIEERIGAILARLPRPTKPTPKAGK